MRDWLAARSTGDVLVLLVAFTICGSVIIFGGAVTVFAYFNPGIDVTAPARFVADVINTLIGLLAGFLAGRTDVAARKRNGNGDAAGSDSP